MPPSASSPSSTVAPSGKSDRAPAVSPSTSPGPSRRRPVPCAARRPRSSPRPRALPRQRPHGLSQREVFLYPEAEMETYDPQAIEAKWQGVWEDARAFYTDDPEAGEERAKFYMLEMLPYPSGDLHMGHVLNYTLG